MSSAFLGAVKVSSVGAAALALHAAVNARLLRVPSPGSAPAGSGPKVSVLVPARNEALRIAPTIESALAQLGVDLELLVLDDGSTDATADVVRSAAGGDGRLRVVAGAPLPPGWLGKPHACQQLADLAAGEVLVFVDADVVLQPHAVASAVELMQHHGLSMVSPYPRQVAVAGGERLVQPLLQWLWLTFLPLRLAERLTPVSMAAANGQFLVMEADAYRAAGGHRVVRDRVVEDVWLARAFKAAGRRAVVVDGTDLASCRMYTGWGEVRDGYSKSLWAAFGSPAGAAAMAASFAALYLLPPTAVVAGLAVGQPRLARWGSLGYLSGVAGRVVSARRTGGRPADSLAHPASIGALIFLLARSWRQKATGRLTWRGRTVG